MKHHVDKLVSLSLLVILALFIGFSAVAEKIGDATITLQSHKYYKKWDLTRLVYRVKSSKNNIPEYWVLGTGGCITEDQIDIWSSTEFTWVDEPIEGLRFESSSKNERFYLWLFGQWDVGTAAVAVAFEAGDTYQGAVDGPLCEGSSISVEVIAGSTVEFPQILKAGTFPSTTNTQLAISSTSSEWNLDHVLTFSIPESAQQSVVERIFQVVIAPYDSSAGATEIVVSYTLDVSDNDFSGLPEGAYVIGITYTVAVDD